jgi:hypothetical protein
MKKVLFLFGLAVLAIFVIRFISGEDGWICQKGEWVKHGNPSDSKPENDCGNEKKENQNENNKQKDSNIFNGQKSESGNIIVSSPSSQEEIGFPLIVKGEASVFENQFSIRLKEKSGRILASVPAYAKGQDAGKFGAFQEEIGYLTPKNTEGILEVFDESMKDGSEIDKVQIPVKLPRIESMAIKIFVGKIPKNTDCKEVYPIERRILKTPAVGKLAISELLKGITETEKMKGYFTNLNSGIELDNLTIENGIAKADFSGKMEEGIGGSCKAEGIQAQITQTLKQFPTVKSVTISINGQTDRILQP